MKPNSADTDSSLDEMLPQTRKIAIKVLRQLDIYLGLYVLLLLAAFALDSQGRPESSERVAQYVLAVFLFGNLVLSQLSLRTGRFQIWERVRYPVSVVSAGVFYYFATLGGSEFWFPFAVMSIGMTLMGFFSYRLNPIWNFVGYVVPYLGLSWFWHSGSLLEAFTAYGPPAGLMIVTMLVVHKLASVAIAHGNEVERLNAALAEKVETSTEELKVKQEELMHSEKLASIGELVAGVGHEIKNPLAIADGNLDLISKCLDSQKLESEQVSDAIERCKIANMRIANIVNGLRIYARMDSKSQETFDVVELAKQSVFLIKDIYFQKGIELSLTTTRSEAYIQGSGGRIQQVLMNLLSNARDAMEGQSSAPDGAPSAKINIQISTSANFVTVVVGDNGPGIPAEVRSKIFDSFFTTKESGKGTGIGLSLTKSIVEGEHKGKIRVESETGKGTRFILDFPIAEPTDNIVANLEDYQRKEEEQSSGQARAVLIVDDEEGLREILRDRLEDEGCKVEEAANGEEALSKIRSVQFDLVLSDINMPKMDGISLAKELVNEGKVPRFVLVTGDDPKSVMDSLDSSVRKVVSDCISKPYVDSEIESAIHGHSAGSEKKAA